MDERDCIFPDCLVRVMGRRACEHSCPFQEDKFREEEQRAGRAPPKPYSQDCLASEVPGGTCQAPDCVC